MSPPKPPAASGSTPEPESTGRGGGDPWQAFGYVVSGVAVYGVAGYWLDRWWGTSFMVVLGILGGFGLGTYLTVKRFGSAPPVDEHVSAPQHSTAPAPAPQRSSSARREQD